MGKDYKIIKYKDFYLLKDSGLAVYSEEDYLHKNPKVFLWKNLRILRYCVSIKRNPDKYGIRMFDTIEQFLKYTNYSWAKGEELPLIEDVVLVLRTWKDESASVYLFDKNSEYSYANIDDFLNKDVLTINKCQQIDEICKRYNIWH